MFFDKNKTEKNLISNVKRESFLLKIKIFWFQTLRGKAFCRKKKKKKKKNFLKIKWKKILKKKKKKINIKKNKKKKIE